MLIVRKLKAVCHSTRSQSSICTLRDFLCSKVRFIHTSTVTGSHSARKKTTRTPRINVVLPCFEHVCCINMYAFSFFDMLYFSKYHCSLVINSGSSVVTVYA